MDSETMTPDRRTYRRTGLSGSTFLGLRAALLVGVSTAALVTMSASGNARPLGSQSPSSSATAMAIAAGQAAQLEASRAARDAQNALKRATLAIQAMQISQQAARDVAGARPNAMPNGLKPGGLQIGAGVVRPNGSIDTGLWQGANLPTESANGDQTNVTVKQTQQKAILTWNTFNVGGKTELYFDQRAGGANASEWIALNRVVDPGTAPSKILGSIKAEGQVYVINKNGIIFDGASQVNVATLVASSLALSNEQFVAGINTQLYLFNDGSGNRPLAKPQFGEYATTVPLGTSTPPFVPSYVPGDVVVERGAVITASSGGKLMLFAPKVRNAGSLAAPDGQVIMAAGENVWLMSPPPSTDGKPATLRGLQVATSAPSMWPFPLETLQAVMNGANDSYTNSIRDLAMPAMEARAAEVGYQVVNSGHIEVQRGNITLQSREIVQSGVLLATTALNNRDGSIILQASDQGLVGFTGGDTTPRIYRWAGGTLTLAPDSVTAVMPDLADTSEIENSSLATRYRPGSIELYGRLIDVQSRASVVVPAGKITAVAAANPYEVGTSPGPGDDSLLDGSRIYIDTDAYLSTAGVRDVIVAMERNFIEADLRINELRDSPLYKDSWLRGTKVIVDRRLSGKFADGPMAGVEWVQDEAGNYIPGAWIGTPLADVSAWIGVGKTDLAELSTKGGSILLKAGGSVITRKGSVLDVSGGSVRYADGWNTATKLLGADGKIYDIGSAMPDQAYVAIASGFTRNHAHWNIAETWTNPLGKVGRRWEPGYTEGRDAGSIQIFSGAAPILEGSYWGGVIVGERQVALGNVATGGTLTVGGNDNDTRSWSIGELVIDKDAVSLPNDFGAATPVDSAIYGSMTDNKKTYIDADALSGTGMGRIDLYVSKGLVLNANAKVELDPGAAFGVKSNIAATGGDTAEFVIDGSVHSAGGHIEFGGIGSTLKFSAQVVLDASGRWINDLTNGPGLLHPIDGGAIVLIGNLDVAQGAILDVSGGGWVQNRGSKANITAGDAGTIRFPRPDGLAAFDTSDYSNFDMRAFAAGSGGELSIDSIETIQLGGERPAGSSILYVPGSLYSERGFRKISLFGDVTIPDGAQIIQQPVGIDLSSPDIFTHASGGRITDVGKLAVLRPDLRIGNKPGGLTLEVPAIDIGADVLVRTDIGGAIAITSTGNAIVGGTLETAAGSISISSTLGTLRIASGARLLAPGASVTAFDGHLRSDIIRSGGTVSLFAEQRLDVEAGSLIDVSGASGMVEFGAGGFGRKRMDSFALASDAGSIALRVGLGGAGTVNGSFKANAGGEGAAGGSLTIFSAGQIELATGATTPATGMSVLAPSVAAGGFSRVSLSTGQDLVLDDGLEFAIDGELLMSSARLTNGGTGGSAHIKARRLQLSSETPQIAVMASGGTLVLEAPLIDLARTTSIRGFADTRLVATDIRFTRLVSDLGSATLDVAGRLTLTAAQIYPDSGVPAYIKATDTLTIARNGESTYIPLTAGGSLNLEAPVIEQDGVLRAPFGQINLKAATRLTLGTDSVTSVSGDGAIVPYGTLSNGEYWNDPNIINQNDPTASYMNAPPEKRIVLDAPSIDSKTGSVLDIHGGGDLYASEFVRGPGGSHDILAMGNVRAILPGYTGPGEKIWLAGGNGLAAGWYTLLSARYAALPGAFAVMAAGGAPGATLPKAAVLADGSVMMSGRRSNGFAGTSDQYATTWRVMPGSVIRSYTEYNEAFANQFFASDTFKDAQYRLTGQEVVTPRLPGDGGTIVLKATQDLILDGTLKSQAAAGGRGGLVDIASTKIAILGEGHDAGTYRTDGYLVLDAERLTAFGAGSLLIGGTRSGDPLGLKLDVAATDVVVLNDAASVLKGPEIILAASNGIDIGAGSVIIAEGEIASADGSVVMTSVAGGDRGALLRLSNGSAVSVVRRNVVTNVGGLLTIGDGAVVSGGKALLIDTTQNASIAATVQISGTALSLSSGKISFGGGSDGLIVSNEMLALLANTQRLTLRSYSSIDFYNSFRFSGAGQSDVMLDAAAFVGHGANAISITGSKLALVNSGTAQTASGSGNGTLSISADTLAIGKGAKLFSGFGAVSLNAERNLIIEGSGSLDAGASALTLTASVTAADKHALQSFVTTGLLTLAGSGSADEATADSFGAKLAFSGGSVVVSGRIVAHGGNVDVTATSGDVEIANGGMIDVSGVKKDFYDVARYVDAGEIGLTANGGDVRLASGATLNLAAAYGGGNAGKLSVAAKDGLVALDGSVAAQAGAGGNGGKFALDNFALSRLASLNQKLDASGFTASREFRVRTGDVIVDGAATAADFSVSADQGRVTITGAVDARTTYGGNILISGGNGLVMEGSASLMAGATNDEGLSSGRVTLEAAGGRLAVNGGTIDVSGGQGGKVRFRALQTAGHDEISTDAVSATILGARSAVLEGVSVNNSMTTGAVRTQAIADAGTFAANANAIAGRLGLGGGIALMSGIEIRSSGDLTVDGDWNLFADFASQREGTLTLRAGGNLIVNGNISDGFNTGSTSGVLQDTASWNLRLVAGADLTSASSLNVKPISGLAANSGTLTVGTSSTGRLIRTGTGDIDVRAGRDINLAHNQQSVIYTAGRRDMTTWADFSAPSNATYGIDGGNLAIAAQGTIRVPVTDLTKGQHFSEWLNRRGALDTNSTNFQSGQQSTWWINYGSFEQGVGALGGGNVAVSAGGDLVNLVVALPTNARVRGGRTAGEERSLEMRNGGLMSVDAGGAIRGGQYYVGRGDGVIEANEMTIGDRRVTAGTGGTAITYTVAPVLALGDANLSVRTLGDLRLQTVVDPLMVRYGGPMGTETGDLIAYMSGYTDRTALDIASSSGDVTLANQSRYIFRNAAAVATNFLHLLVGYGGNRYPSITHITALDGSINLEGQISTLPAAQSDLALLAAEDIAFSPTIGGTATARVSASVLMARATPEMITSPFFPVMQTISNQSLLASYFDAILNNATFVPLSGVHGLVNNLDLRNPATLVLANDYEPSRFYALNGSILGGVVQTNEQTWFRAGEDIRGMTYTLRNIRPTDVSLLEAGRDIIGNKPLQAPLNTTFGSVEMQGPGALVVSAGRNIYGESLKIQSSGNQLYDSITNVPTPNTKVLGLPDEGASVTMMAGINHAPAYDAFTAAYLDPANLAAMPDYLRTKLPDGTVVPLYLTDAFEARTGGDKNVRRGLVSFIAETTGETLSPLAAWARFQTLPEFTKQRFLRLVYMQELRDAGRDQNTSSPTGGTTNVGINRGYDAIAKLFPGNRWKGDIKLADLAVTTQAGGDIEVLTPGGGLELASLGAVVPAGSGLITLGPGDIHVFARNDITVNRSRVLTFAGGDGIIWSTLGDIDAGRGAKTTRAPTAPNVITDADANTKIFERADVSGSGIGTVAGFSGVEEGDFDLDAPGGSVNAGDAGIRVSGNFNIVTPVFFNADNLDVTGKSKGVAVVTAPNLGGLTEAGNVAGASAHQVVSPAQNQANGQLSVIIVEFLGYGGGGDGDDTGNKEDQRRGAPGRQGYNIESPVQVIGNGELTSLQKSQLTEREKENYGDGR